MLYPLSYEGGGAERRVVLPDRARSIVGDGPARAPSSPERRRRVAPWSL